MTIDAPTGPTADTLLPMNWLFELHDTASGSGAFTENGRTRLASGTNDPTVRLNIVVKSMLSLVTGAMWRALVGQRAATVISFER